MDLPHLLEISVALSRIGKEYEPWLGERNRIPYHDSSCGARLHNQLESLKRAIEWDPISFKALLNTIKVSETMMLDKKQQLKIYINTGHGDRTRKFGTNSKYVKLFIVGWLLELCSYVEYWYTQIIHGTAAVLCFTNDTLLLFKRTKKRNHFSLSSSSQVQLELRSWRRALGPFK